MDLPEDGAAHLRALSSLSLLHAHDATRLALDLSGAVTRLVITERPLCADMVSRLAACRRLRELRVLLEPHAERALPAVCAALTTLELRWAYSQAELSLARSHAGTHRIEWYAPCSDAVLRAVRAAPQLSTLRLEYARLRRVTVADALQAVGRRLRAFGTSLESQRVAVDEQLLCVMQCLARYCGDVREVRFCEASEGTEGRYRMVGMSEARRYRLSKGVERLRRRARLLDMEAVDEAVARMCGTGRDGWRWSVW